MSQSSLRQQFITGAGVALAAALAADPQVDHFAVVEQYANEQGMRRATWATWNEQCREGVVDAVRVQATELLKGMP